MGKHHIQHTYRLIKKILESAVLENEIYFTHSALYNSKGLLIHTMGPLPLHYFSFSQSIQNLLKYFKLGPDDIIVTNDPALGSPRLCDIHFFKAVYNQNELRGYTAIQLSLPGLLNTPNIFEAKLIDEEGYKIPPTPLDAKGEIKAALIQYLSASGIKSELLQELFDLTLNLLNRISSDYIDAEKRFGKTYVTQQLQELELYTEEILSKNLHRFPDGEFSSQIKFQSHTINTRVKIKGASFIVDFNGSSKQTGHSFNCPYNLTLSTCFWFFLKLLEEEIPINNGLFHALTVEAPVGSLVNPQGSPAQLEGYYKITSLIAQNLSQITKKGLPQFYLELHPSLCFVYQSDKGIYSESLGSGKDASSKSDGSDNCKTDFHKLKIKSLEKGEEHWPIRFDFFSTSLRHEKSSQFRGALGVRLEFEVLNDGKFKIYNSTSSYGEECFLQRDGHRTELKELQTYEVMAQDKIFLQTPSGKDKGTKELD